MCVGGGKTGENTMDSVVTIVTQVVGILVYIGVLFVLYKHLVSAKDALLMMVRSGGGL